MIKKILSGLLAASVLAFSGCVNGQSKSPASSSMTAKVAAFVAQLPAINMTGIAQDFSCPLWSNSESAESVATTFDGKITVTGAKVGFKIPLWGTVSSASVQSISFAASPEQIAAGLAILKQAQAAQAAAAAAAATVPVATK